MTHRLMVIPGGAVAMAVIGIGLAVTALAAMNWQGAAAALNGLAASIADWVGHIGSGFKNPGDIYNPGADPFAIPDSSPKLQKQGWNVIPKRDGRPIVLSSALNIDGRTLAETIASHMAALYENSSVSPAANGLAMLDFNGGFTAS